MSSHVKNRGMLHFVWTTDKRMPWIRPEIEESVHRYIQSVAQKDGCEVLAIGGMPDHIHLLVCLSTTVSIARLMQHIKGGSSYLIQKDLLPGSFFQWQAGYALFGVSPSHRTRVAAYIRDQKRHHQEGTLWEGAEPDLEEPTDFA
jgi:putative transposase